MMIAKKYKVYLSDCTESEEFAYSPSEAAEQTLLCWMQQHPERELPKIVSIRASSPVADSLSAAKMFLKINSGKKNHTRES